MNRRSFLKLSALGVAGAGLALRSGAIFAVPRIVKPAVGLEAWLHDPNGPQPFFGLDRPRAIVLKDLYAPLPQFHFEVGDTYFFRPDPLDRTDPSAMVVTAVDRFAKVITVSPLTRLQK